MSELWEVLGYDETIADVSLSLMGDSDIQVVEGPPGCGKSRLALGVGTAWELAGGSAVVAEGAPRRSDVSLYVLKSAMRGVGGNIAWAQILAKLAKSGENLLGTGGLLTTGIEVLAETRRMRQRNQAILLDDQEQDILVRLAKLGQKGPILLIADNLHWWDARSLNLLGSLRDQRMSESFTFLTEMRVLAVQTTERHQPAVHPEARDALLSPLETQHMKLPRVPLEDFGAVLCALGTGVVPSAEITEAVFRLSGGNLALASKCAARIAAGEGEMFLAITDERKFVRSLLSERMRNLGPTGRQAVELLEVAAILGLAFNRGEVMCASSVEESETARLLRFCREEQILETMEESWIFVHEHYHRYFLGLGGEDRATIHERWGKCLKRLRPSDYDLRCVNALDGDAPKEAAVFGILAALQAAREGRPWEKQPPAILNAISAEGVAPIVELLTDALKCLRACRFGDCMTTLNRLPRSLAKPVAAEADYLRAMCLMSTRSEQDRAKGRLILESWDGYIEEEPEIGMRLMLLLLYGFFHLRDKQPGWALEARIIHLLSDRASYDPAAEDALYTLDRCAGGLHPSNAALDRVREAVAHFEPKEGDLVVRRPGEYYRCMVNLVANLIENAEYPEAHEVSLELVQFMAKYDTEAFARAHYPYTNQLQAEYRLGMVDAKEAVLRQRKIVEEHGFADDPYYPENALAVYLALAGYCEEAFQILDRLDTELTQTRTSPEPSMIYLIRGNRCAVSFVSGDLERAQLEWPSLTSVAAESNYTDRDLLLLRHELLSPEIAAGNVMTPTEFDVFLLEHHPDRGSLWNNSAHGFVLPAVELWRGEN